MMQTVAFYYCPLRQRGRQASPLLTHDALGSRRLLGRIEKLKRIVLCHAILWAACNYTEPLRAVQIGAQRRTEQTSHSTMFLCVLTPSKTSL